MVGLVPRAGSAGSRRKEGGGESQCTDENSESAIAGEKWILPCAFVRLLWTSLLDDDRRQGQERGEDAIVRQLTDSQPGGIEIRLPPPRSPLANDDSSAQGRTLSTPAQPTDPLVASGQPTVLNTSLSVDANP